jgi:hypothetical protein
MENISNSENTSIIIAANSGFENNAETGNILKYLYSIASRLAELKCGMEKNIGCWNGLPETPEILAEHVHETLALGIDIEKLKKELSKKYTQARQLRKEKKILIDTLEKRAIGIHVHQQTLLGDYGIKHKEK